MEIKQQSFNCSSSFNGNYQIPILWFLIDIDLIFKFFKHIHVGSSFFGSRHFQIFISRSRDFQISPNHILILFGISFILWSKLDGPKLNIIGFGGHGHVQKSENHKNDEFWVFTKSNRNVTSQKWSRIIQRSVWVIFFSKNIIKMTSQSPQTSNPRLSGFSRNVYRKSAVFQS